MSNVLGDDKKQSVLALGRLGWSLRLYKYRNSPTRGLPGSTLSGGRF
jgi:hypothetical protein